MKSGSKILLGVNGKISLLICPGNNLRNQSYPSVFGQSKSEEPPFFKVGGWAVTTIWFAWTLIKESFWLIDVLIVPLLMLGQEEMPAKC